MTELEYLLTKITEECSEVQQRVCKAQEFGLDEIQPNQAETNKDRITFELNDLWAILEMIEEKYKLGIGTRIQELIDLKKEKVVKYMKYSKELGILKEET